VTEAAEPKTTRNRRWLWLAVALFAVAGCAAGGWYWWQRGLAGAADGSLAVYVVDVGQGDAFIIQTPGGKTYVVDAGSDAEATLIPELRALKVARLAAVMVSHPHQDHIGGVPDLLKSYPVGTLYDCGYRHTSRSYRETLKLVKEKRINYVTPRAGDRYDWDGAAVEILHPDRADYDNLNDNSIVFRLTYGSSTMLFTGDAEGKAREAILRRFRNRVAADILKLAHHGSTNGTTADWLQLVAPRQAIICCGVGNHFGHPHPPVVQMLKQNSVTALRTDLQGTIKLVSDGERWTVTPLGKSDARLPDDADAEQ